jgi:hypothetical protein
MAHVHVRGEFFSQIHKHGGRAGVQPMDSPDPNLNVVWELCQSCCWRGGRSNLFVTQAGQRLDDIVRITGCGQALNGMLVPQHMGQIGQQFEMFI